MTQFKKLALISITLLIGVINGGVAQAQVTNYSFSYNYAVSPDGDWLNAVAATVYTLSGTVTGNGTTLSDPIFTTLSGAGLGGASYSIVNQSNTTP
jgi:hypothetical protein